MKFYVLRLVAPGKYTIIWLHLDVVTPIITREYPSYRVFHE
jgi:hypothetical protein